MASTPWSGSGPNLALDNDGNPEVPGTFALEANDNGTSPDTIVTSGYTNLDNTGMITGDLGDIVGTNGLWLSLSSSGIPNATYSGSIYYKIANGS